jgi:serine/threonine protein kinase/WD40 repeat protein
MTTWNPHANDLFLKALELRSADQRQKYLEEACTGDEALRAEVESLLEASAQAAGFLESPAAGLAATIDEPITERPGRAIGHYKLLEQIGEGGFGVVFMAEQQEPIRRKVALKVLKPGMDTRQVIARFEAERQALALMDHPNIAKVLDAGQTGSGRPYFVMDLVKGLPITEFCDQAQLTPRERLELFLRVCQAVQHAHQKGIIHRDIKPSNVLVTLHDGTPEPKIIDFGIAKALGQQLTDKTLFTSIAQMIGTPLYMSPEQAALGTVDVDTRSDIYSLGVLLYELLTGTTPFDKERFKEVGYDELYRIIREEEPPKPSTRISTMVGCAQRTGTPPPANDAASPSGVLHTPYDVETIATQRKSDPKRLSQLFRGELDWIVMKCLEKDRNRRYETASAFAADVQHYLHDEPVQACPPSLGYRLRKFGHKHGKLLATGAAFAVLLITLAVGSSLFAWSTERQLQETRRAQDETELELYHSLVAQARANRLSRRVGQRFESLAILEQATQLARRLNLPEENFRELRNEAIACLALTDMRVAKECTSTLDGSNPYAAFEGKLERYALMNTPYGSNYYIAFDGKLERYALKDPQGNISVRRVTDDAEICHVQCGPGWGFMSLSCDGQFLAALGTDRVKLWQLVGPDPTLIQEEPGRTWFAFSPDCRLFAIQRADGSIDLVDLPSLRPVRRLPPGLKGFMAFNPKGRQLAVASGGSLQVRDLETGKVHVEFHYPLATYPKVVWHPDGKTVAMVGGDQVIYVGDVATGKQTVKLEGLKNDGTSPTFNHAGDLLATTGWEGILRLWDPRTGQQLFQTPGGWCDPTFSPDDRLLAADVKENRLRLWEVAPSRTYRTLVRDPALGKAEYWDCAVSPQGRLLTAATQDGLGFWDCHTGTPLAFVRFDFVFHVVFEASGALLTAQHDSLYRWPVRPDPAAPGLLRIGPPHRLLPATDMPIACSPDGCVVASSGRGDPLVWHRNRPGELIRLSHDVASNVSVSPDGRWVATGTDGRGGAKVWDAATGRLVKDLVPNQPFVSVGFSPDGKWLLTSQGPCQLWAVDSWQEGRSLGEGRAFAFSPAGRLLALETGQGVVRLVDSDSDREYARLEDPNQDRATTLAFSPDGTQLIVSADRKWLHVWDLRAIRVELAQRGLDWDLPSYPVAGLADTSAKDAPPLQITVDLGDLSLGYVQAPYLNNQAWLLATHPEAKLRDPTRAVELAQKAVKVAPKEGTCWNTLGVAHYRAGHWKIAIEALTKSMELKKGKDESFDTLFLAMAHWQLDEKEKARQWYDRAVLWMEKNKDQLQGNKQRLEELRRFRAEAAALLGIESLPAQPETKMPPAEAPSR